MAKTKKAAHIQYWKGIYKNALDYLEVDYSKNISLPKLRKLFQAERKRTKKEQRTDFPKLREAAKKGALGQTLSGDKFKEWADAVNAAEEAEEQYDYEWSPRDRDYNTEAAEFDLEQQQAEEFINNIKIKLKELFNDAINQANSWKDKERTSEDRREDYILYLHIDEIEYTYREVLRTLQAIIDTVGIKEAARVIGMDYEIDYAAAVEFVPPSGWINNFAITLEYFQGILNRISS